MSRRFHSGGKLGYSKSIKETDSKAIFWGSWWLGGFVRVCVCGELGVEHGVLVPVNQHIYITNDIISMVDKIGEH